MLSCSIRSSRVGPIPLHIMTADDVADERGSHLQTLNKKSSESRGAELLDIGFSVVYEPNEADPVVE